VPKGQKSSSTIDVIARFRKKHGDRYDYSSVVFNGSHTKVTINCPQHGSFEQTPAIHIRKSGCPECGKIEKGQKRRKSPEQAIEAFRAVHGLRYDYTPTVYTTNRSKVTINCRIHGAFDMLPDNHLKGRGCRICGLSSDRQLAGFDPTEEFRSVHGDRYDYSQFVYKGANVPGTIICPDHGPFEQAYGTHKNGHGCPDCGFQRTSESKTFTQDEILDRFQHAHGSRYGYDLVEYVHTERPVAIVCHQHGVFHQTPKAHSRGSGCPKCVGMISKGETDIGDFIESLGYEVDRNTRTLIPPKEVDLYIAAKNLAIEYCGLYWHGERFGKGKEYHQDKQQTLADRGIDLITIFDDEWLDRPDVVKSILRTRLDKAPTGVGARHLSVEQILPHDSAAFLNTYHIQGSATGSIHLGAFHNGDLVGVMVFGEPTRQTSSYEWELKRFATNGAMYPGMMSKLFQHFIKNHSPESIVSFSDNRWFMGGSYQQLGFHKDGEIAPDYYYVKNNIRHHKSKFRKSGIKRMHPDQYDPSLTERVMMENLEYDRVWDCGKIRWVWTRDV